MPFEIKKLNETWFENVDWANSGIEARRMPSGRGDQVCACDSENRIMVFSLGSSPYEMKDGEYFVCLVIDKYAFEFRDVIRSSSSSYEKTDFEFCSRNKYDTHLAYEKDSKGLLAEGFNLIRDFYNSKR